MERDLANLGGRQKGRRSGVEVDQRFAYLYTLREADEKIVRCQLFSTVQAAMDAAAGLASAAPDR
jgi:hypothetical protein